MRLTDLLTINHIKIPVESTQRDKVIKELVDQVPDQVNDIQQAYDAVMEREKIMTTGVGNGIAIPHCKHHSCPDFVIVLGISDKQIDFNAIDNKKVNLIFLLLGPENNPGMHIKLLSRISRLMSDENFRNKLCQSETAENAYALIKEQEAVFPEIE